MTIRPGLVEVAIPEEFWLTPIFPGSYFVWAEFVPREVRSLLTEAVVANIRTLTWYHLDPARRECGFPIYIHPHGGFTPPPFHTRWGHVEDSQHRDGSAADLNTADPSQLPVVDSAVTATKPYKLGRYASWLHVGTVGVDFIHHGHPASW